MSAPQNAIQTLAWIPQGAEMVMNGKRGGGEEDMNGTLMGVPLPTLLSDRRLGPGQAWKGKKARAPRRWV